MDYPFLSKESEVLSIGDRVSWYSRRYKATIVGTIFRMKISRSYSKSILTNLSIHGLYPGCRCVTIATVRPSSVTKLSVEKI